MGHPTLVVAVYASVVQEMLAAYPEKLVVLVPVSVVPLQHVQVKQLDLIVMQQTTYVNAHQLYLLAVGRPIRVLAAFVSAEQETHAVYQVKHVARVTASAAQHQVALDLQLDPIAMRQTMYVNAPQQLILVVEHRTHVLVAFANVELRTRVVTRVKLAVQDLVSAELRQRVLE